VRALVQRVKRAAVAVDGEVIGEIGAGLLIFIGVTRGDSDADINRLVEKLSALRVFPSADGSSGFDRSVCDIDNGAVLLISQFTLYASLAKGRRPSFIDAAPPEIAQPLFDATARAFKAKGLTVATGKFGAMMDVELVNAGPATFTYDTNAA